MSSRSPPSKRRRLTSGVSPVVPAYDPQASHRLPRAVHTQATPGHAGKAGEDGGLWLIVGLGNPGAQYERTRHNVGFMVVDILGRAHDIDCRKLEKSAAVGKGTIEGKQVLLVKPMTFMNNSGESISALAQFYKVPTKHILVISDDLDIPHASLRLRASGGHGGHNGLRSISERMGNTQDYPRIKIGIGRPAGQLSVSAWVLQDFTRHEQEELEVSLQQAADIVRCVLAQGIDKAVSIQNPKPAKAAPKKAPAAAGAPRLRQAPPGAGSPGTRLQADAVGAVAGTQRVQQGSVVLTSAPGGPMH